MNEKNENEGDGKSPGFDMTLKDLSLDEIIRQLTGLRDRGMHNWKVRIAHSSGTLSCVGKIMAAGSDDSGMIFLFPVPEDIEKYNALTRLMSMMVCDKAMGGQDCNKCPDMTNCNHLKMFGDNYRMLDKACKTEKAKDNEDEAS